ncbi:DUF805 domain-containing protein [Streptomyces odontomachi]|uniref:DUF805 domain-containing protein n=1 Tax=Streptomyces odontomachi TaxID=2944940 RepID=UPI00210928A1|nr:DUF805 domain-containing protein [Streptomyces sp. ODS25]
MGFAWAIRRGFTQYARWGGRASRSEYWWFTLFDVVCYILCIALTVKLEAPLFMLFWVAGVAPAELGVFVRRLHDTGRSGWWWFLGCIPLFGLIMLVVFFCQAGDPYANEYGLPPVRPGTAWT